MIKRVLKMPYERYSNVYFVEDENGDAIMIDCGSTEKEIADFVAEKNLNVKAVLLTHGHFDHIIGLKYADNRLIDVFIHEAEGPMLADDELNLSAFVGEEVPHIERFKTLSEGKYDIFGFDVEVIPTPGHTKGSVCYLIGGILFSGDTLFYGTCGRCDFPTSDTAEMKRSLKKLLSLDKDLTVYPGHGRFTTVSNESKTFAYLLNEK